MQTESIIRIKIVKTTEEGFRLRITLLYTLIFSVKFRFLFVILLISFLYSLTFIGQLLHSIQRFEPQEFHALSKNVLSRMEDEQSLRSNILRLSLYPQYF